MTLHWPQIAYLTLSVLSIGIQWERHGKPKQGDESVWISLASVCIMATLLYFGGFFGSPC